MKAKLSRSISKVVDSSVIPREIATRLAAEPFAVERVKSIDGPCFRVLDPNKSLHGWLLCAEDIELIHPPT